MNAYDFKTKWGPGGPAYDLNERQGAQSYFNDLCDVLGVPQPGADARTQGDYLFEKQTLALGQQRGFADVFKRGAFAWENKAPGKSLDAALKQLLNYSHALDNPPLLVVCDRLEIRICTQFTGHPSQQYTVRLDEITLPQSQALLRRLWQDPESFRPKQTNRDITERAAHSFATLAEQLRKRGHHADNVAHFLTQCLFCFFAEDVGLLPGRMFERLVGNRHLTSDRLTNGLQTLFVTMQSGGLYGADDIPWFNGGLFKKIDVPKLEIIDITELRNAASLNWSAIDVSIFGTLFERGLDPSKRSQLGAHYTDPATIMRIIEPVLRRPLLQKWELTKQQILGLLAKSAKYNDKNYKAAKVAFIQWLEQLRDYRVLDPACGSGNFLFLGLKTLKDIEHQSHIEAATLGLDRETDLMTGPHNVLGIELNEYAAELARVTVWIGELQWRLAHGYEFKTNPVLEPLDNIECRDALLVMHPEPAEASWPKASVVIGNPPFLGGSKKRRELGDAYFEALDKVFKNRVPGGADLVCYWFEKSRKAIETSGLGAAGLVSTQSIRAGSNRRVLEAIVCDTRIFEAWSDEPWINDGAAVRVSLVAFGWGDCCFLNGARVERVTADLSNAKEFDITTAQNLFENTNTSFEGTKKYGDFDIPGELARQWLLQPNPHGKSNTDVVKPWRNGQDVAKRPNDIWIIDYGTEITESDAALYEAPFTYITQSVKPERARTKIQSDWWVHERPRIALRRAIQQLPRYIITPRVAKHRYFLHLDATVLPDTRLNVIARSDDTTFGILSSRIHEVWSLAQASMHGVGNDPTYNAKSCFETFPFPAGLTPADTAHQHVEHLPSGACIPAGILVENKPVVQVSTTQAATKLIVNASAVHAAAVAIAQAAKQLDDLRNQWLNPPEWTRRVPEVTPLGMTSSPYPDRVLPRDTLSQQDAKALQKRTLTNLYNLRQNGQVHWLAHAHQQLDAAVAAAYGWADYSDDMPDATILQRLLALNLARSAQ